MGLTGMEPILDQLKTQLEAHMPAKLDALEAALSPALALKDVSVHVGDRSSFEGDQYPAIALLSLDSEPQHERAGRVNFGHKVGVRVVVVEMGNLEENLERLLLRYARAVSEVLLDREAAGSLTAFTLRFEDTWVYSPAQKNYSDTLERNVLIPITCWKAEER